jgi:hypothetical protein
MGDDRTDRERRESGRSGYPNQRHANANQQSQRTHSFTYAGKVSQDSGTPKLSHVSENPTGGEIICSGINVSSSQ